MNVDDLYEHSGGELSIVTHTNYWFNLNNRYNNNNNNNSFTQEGKIRDCIDYIITNNLIQPTERPLCITISPYGPRICLYGVLYGDTSNKYGAFIGFSYDINKIFSVRYSSSLLDIKSINF